MLLVMTRLKYNNCGIVRLEIPKEIDSFCFEKEKILIFLKSETLK